MDMGARGGRLENQQRAVIFCSWECPEVGIFKICCCNFFEQQEGGVESVKKKLTSVKDRLEQAEVLLIEFNEVDDCRTEH